LHIGGCTPNAKKEETIARFPLDFAYIICRSIFRADLRKPCHVLLRREPLSRLRR